MAARLDARSAASLNTHRCTSVLISPLAYLYGESGDINTLVHLWVFKDAADRASKRAAMASDPEWRTYLKLAEEADFLIDQHNSLMVPASFAPIKG